MITIQKHTKKNAFKLWYNASKFRGGYVDFIDLNALTLAEFELKARRQTKCHLAFCPAC